MSVSLGLFVGSLPLYGLHLPLCLVLCLPLGLDAVVAYVAANISNPLLAPFIVAAEFWIGSFLLHGRAPSFASSVASPPALARAFGELMLGGVVFGALLALPGGFIAYGIARRRASPTPLALARARTVARYAQATPGDRYYVAAKLRFDPCLPQIAALGSLGDVIDAGCGRGQLGLCLKELGLVERLSGFDFDERKLCAARTAARSDAVFTHGDLLSAALEPADSILLVDVLHYLAPAEQDAVLERAASVLRADGRLIVRELDASSRRRSRLARAFEWLATKSGYNRAARPLGFRPLEELVRVLSRLGLQCELVAPEGGAALENRLIVARRALASD